MEIKKRKKGFTLLEIMIVIIIVGVLAALALPRLFGTIEYSRSTEALASISSIRSAMERCYLEPQSFTSCGNWSNLDLPNPGTSPGAHFSYNIGNLAATTYTIVAQRNTLDGGIASSCVGLNQSATALTKCGTGKFEKLGNAALCTAVVGACSN